MTIKEIEKKIEDSERNVERNTDVKYVHGLQALALWEISLQIARAVEAITGSPAPGETVAKARPKVTRQ